MSAKKPLGRKPFEPDDKQRLSVEIMAACGLPHPHICSQIINPSTGKPIDPKTLRQAFRSELKKGMETANGMVVQSLFKKATGTGAQSVTAAIFWLKCRAGWKPVEGVEVTGKNGAPIESKSTGSVDEAGVRAIVKRLRDEFVPD